MINQELLNKLKVFNINSYESKIWVALLMKGSATAGELSEMAEVPRSRCYDVLESLEKKGFIMMKIGKPIKYLAVSPNEVLERLKQKLNFELAEKIKMIDNIKSTDLMTNLNEMFSDGTKVIKPEELAGLVKNDRNIKNHLLSMMKNSNNILLSTDSNSLRRELEMIKELSNSSSKIKIITGNDVEDSLFEEVSKFAEVKKLNNVKRFCVTDKNAALFLTNNLTSEDSLIWLNSEYSIETLKDLFETKWTAV